MSVYIRHFNKAATSTFSDVTSSLDPDFSSKKEATPASTASKSLMERTFPNKSYTANNISAGDLMVDPTKAAPGLDGNKQVTGVLQSQVDGVKADLAKDFNAMKTEVIETLRDVATDRGYDPKVVEKSIVPEQSMTSLAAVGDLASGGLGTMVTMGLGAIAMLQDIKEAATSLTTGEIESLLEETQRRLASSQKQNTEQMSFDSGAEIKKGSGADYTNTTVADMKMIIQSTPEDLPEMQRLNNVQFALNTAEDNHLLSEKHEGDLTQGNKLEKALERDDTSLVESFAKSAGEVMFASSFLSDLRGLKADTDDISPLEDDQVKESLKAIFNNEPTEQMRRGFSLMKMDA